MDVKSNCYPGSPGAFVSVNDCFSILIDERYEYEQTSALRPGEVDTGCPLPVARVFTFRLKDSSGRVICRWKVKLEKT